MRRAHVTVTSTRQITLPAELCRELHIAEGDQLEVERAGDAIRIRKVARMTPLTEESFLFRLLGSAAGPGGSGARDHDRILAEAERPKA